MPALAESLAVLPAYRPVAGMAAFLAMILMSAAPQAYGQAKPGGAPAKSTTQTTSTTLAMQSAKPAPPPSVAFGSHTAAQARQSMAKLAGNARYAEWLVAYAEALVPLEGALLLLELAPRAAVAERSALLGRSGSLFLLSGHYGEAARSFEAAALAAVPGETQDEWRILAARCRIGAGEFKTARDLAALVNKSAKPAQVSGTTTGSGTASGAVAGSAAVAGPRPKVLLVWAWASLLEGAIDDAWSRAAALLALGTPTAHEKREALLIQWLAASAKDSSFSMVFSDLPAPGDPAGPAQVLRSEYPDSAEAGLSSGRMEVSPVPWMALGVFPQKSREPARKPPSTAKPAQVTPTGISTLQTGWFSRQENAEGLAAGLRAKGYKARIEPQKSASGETRWAVLVDSEGDWQKTQAKLKDSGYESYPAD